MNNGLMVSLAEEKVKLDEGASTSRRNIFKAGGVGKIDKKAEIHFDDDEVFLEEEEDDTKNKKKEKAREEDAETEEFNVRLPPLQSPDDSGFFKINPPTTRRPIIRNVKNISRLIDDEELEGDSGVSWEAMKDQIKNLSRSNLLEKSEKERPREKDSGVSWEGMKDQIKKRSRSKLLDKNERERPIGEDSVSETGGQRFPMLRSRLRSDRKKTHLEYPSLAEEGQGRVLKIQNFNYCDSSQEDNGGEQLEAREEVEKTSRSVDGQKNKVRRGRTRKVREKRRNVNDDEDYSEESMNTVALSNFDEEAEMVGKRRGPADGFDLNMQQQFEFSQRQLLTTNYHRKPRLRRKRSEMGEGEFVCGCGRDYFSYSSLYTHWKNKHGGINFPGSLVPDVKYPHLSPHPKHSITSSRPVSIVRQTHQEDPPGNPRFQGLVVPRLPGFLSNSPGSFQPMGPPIHKPQHAPIRGTLRPPTTIPGTPSNSGFHPSSGQPHHVSLPIRMKLSTLPITFPFKFNASQLEEGFILFSEGYFSFMSHFEKYLQGLGLSSAVEMDRYSVEQQEQIKITVSEPISSAFACGEEHSMPLCKALLELERRYDFLPDEMPIERKIYYCVVSSPMNCTEILAAFLLSVRIRCSLQFYKELTAVMVILRMCLNDYGPVVFEDAFQKKFEVEKPFCDVEDADIVPDIALKFVREYFPKFILNQSLFLKASFFRILGTDPLKNAKLTTTIQFLCNWLYELNFTAAQMHPWRQKKSKSKSSNVKKTSSTKSFDTSIKNNNKGIAEEEVYQEEEEIYLGSEEKGKGKEDEESVDGGAGEETRNGDQQKEPVVAS